MSQAPCAQASKERIWPLFSKIIVDSSLFKMPMRCQASCLKSMSHLTSKYSWDSSCCDVHGEDAAEWSNRGTYSNKHTGWAGTTRPRQGHLPLLRWGLNQAWCGTLALPLSYIPCPRPRFFYCFNCLYSKRREEKENRNAEWKEQLSPLLTRSLNIVMFRNWVMFASYWNLR